MASIMTKRGSQDNVVTYEHICDTRADMASIEDKYVTLGSTCIILKGTSGGMEVYIADSNHQWQSLAIAGGSSSGSGTVVVNSSPLFHVCTSSEVRVNGTPKISSPEENTIYLVPTDGETNNLFNEYLYVNSKWEMIGSAGIDLSEYVTYQDLVRANFATHNDLNNYATHNDLNNYATHDDLNDYASLDYNGKVSTEQLPFPAISSDDNDKILKVKNGDWSVENEVDISGKVDKAYEITFEPKTWNGLTSFSGDDIWTNGKNIYYSAGIKQYILDKSTSTWITKTWNGLTSFSGDDIWTDGENIYYSSMSKQYILDSSTSTWNTKTWKGLTNFDAIDVWTDGENIYYSMRSGSNSLHYVLDKSTSAWNTKTWNGLTRFAGRYIWTDGENIYYSNDTEQYVLDKSTATWNAKTWNGLARFGGDSIWTDGDKIYCYEAYSDHQGVLDESTSTWNTKTWNAQNVLTHFTGSYIWTDGESIYYSNNSSQYILGKNKILLGNNGTFSPVTLEEFTGTLMQKFPRIPEAPSTDEGHVYDFRLPKYASQQSYSEYHRESNSNGGNNRYPCIYTITTEDKQFVDGDRIIIPCIARPNDNHIVLQFGNQYYYIAIKKDYPYIAHLTDIFLPNTYLELVYDASMSLSTYEITGHLDRGSNYIVTGIFVISYSGINISHVHTIYGRAVMRRYTSVGVGPDIPSIDLSPWFTSNENLIEYEQIEMMSYPLPGVTSGIVESNQPFKGYFFTTNNNDYYPVIINESKYPIDIFEFAKSCVDSPNDSHVTYVYIKNVWIDGPFYNLVWDKDTSTMSYEILNHYEGPAWKLTQVSPNCLGYFAARRENTILGHYNEAITQYSDWFGNTSYNIGDCVYNSDEDKSYECVEANSDSTFTKGHWKELPTNYDRLLTIGNGKSSSELSNALTMDSKGNTIISGNFTASGGSLTIGNTTITEAQLISLLNSITG